MPTTSARIWDQLIDGDVSDMLPVMQVMLGIIVMLLRSRAQQFEQYPFNVYITSKHAADFLGTYIMFFLHLNRLWFWKILVRRWICIFIRIPENTTSRCDLYLYHCIFFRTCFVFVFLFCFVLFFFVVVDFFSLFKYLQLRLAPLSSSSDLRAICRDGSLLVY